MSKLTKAQADVLRKLSADGEFVHMLCGVKSHAFWHGDMTTVRTSTIEALRTRKLIASTKGSLIGSLEYRLTDLGRAALTPNPEGAEQ